MINLCQRLREMIQRESVETSETTALVLREGGLIQKYLQEHFEEKMKAQAFPECNIIDPSGLN
jgi:hypothetical protein